MAVAKTVKVNRVRLIEALETSLKEQAKKDVGIFEHAKKEDLAYYEDALARAKQNIKDYESAIKRINKATKLSDLRDRWSRYSSQETSLEQHIALLKLSDEETITVGPSHDLFRYL